MLKTEVTLCPLSFTTQSIFVLLSFQCFHCSHQVQVDSDSMKRFKLSYSQVLFFASTELNLTSTSSVQLSSATQSCSTLWDPIDCSTPGFPVHHQRLEFVQTHVHRVGDAIQPSHSAAPFSSFLQSFPASTSFTVSQFFISHGQSVGASASASVLPMNIQDWFPLRLTDWSPCCPGDS